MARRAARVDANHASVVKALRKIGCVVADTSGAGNGFPDAVCGLRGVIRLLEIKDGGKKRYETRIEPKQVEFHKQWAGFPVHIVYSADEAIAIMTRGE